jgi:lysophospholipase L1-like esterase
MEEIMIGRRTFLKSGVACTGAVATATVGLQAAPGNPSGVGGYDYRLPAFEKGSRMLFQGDSITDMKWGRNERDRNHYLGHSYVYLIASRLGVDMPDARLEFFNRGMSGHKVGDLRARWQKDTIDMKPDVLSILIGINDVGRTVGNGKGFDKWEADYRFILDESRKANPDLRLVLLDPFVLASGRLGDPASFKGKRVVVDRLCGIVAQLVRDYKAVHVRTQDVFDAAAKTVNPAHWIWDGVHPLPQGHELIARNWLQETSARWKA